MSYHQHRIASVYQLLKTFGNKRLSSKCRPVVVSSNRCRVRPIEGIDTEEFGTHLWDTHCTIATPIKHAEIEGLRVKANHFTTLEELNRCVDAMEQVVVTIYLQQTAPDPVNGTLHGNHWWRNCRSFNSLATGLALRVSSFPSEKRKLIPESVRGEIPYSRTDIRIMIRMGSL